MRLAGTDLQRQTLRLYGELVARRESWAGQLVFACGEGSSAPGLSAAVSIAGGTSLVLDPDLAEVKAAFRRGGVDFVVNSLDEALRVLKNEIRKHRPVSVALEGMVDHALTEMQERGVLPDLQVVWGGIAGGAEFPSAELLRMTPSSGVLESWLLKHGWEEVAIECATTAEMRALDARLLKMLPQEDTARRAWVQRIGHYQRPAPGGARVVWLTEAERAAL